MKVVILCGGRGARLREETEYRPKPMVPIGNKPILWHIMKTYSAYGHKEFILCLGYKGEIIKGWFRNLKWMISDVYIDLGNDEKNKFLSQEEELDWKITLVDTGLETMTGGRIKAIQKYIEDDENFLITYGDGVGNININKSIENHKNSNKLLTLTGVRPPGRWGELKIEGKEVKHFYEKPQTSASYINGGYFVANKELFNYLDDDPKLVFEEEPLNFLSSKGLLGCYLHDDFWHPMDTYKEFLLLNKIWSEGRAKWKVW
tara:strand:+ start:1672 stop:2451 length:780 start_codon:yes stop_codon:yes gene_type:complete